MIGQEKDGSYLVMQMPPKSRDKDKLHDRSLEREQRRKKVEK